MSSIHPVTRIATAVCVIAMAAPMAASVSKAELVAGPVVPLAPAGTPIGGAFKYQGQLRKNGAPVTATCDAAFRLFDDGVSGAQLGVVTTTIDAQAGLFSIALDFGGEVFNGQARWLETRVRCPGDVVYATLSPRIALTPAPYAFALPGMRTPRANNDGLDMPTINVIGGLPNNVISPSSYNSVIAGGDGNVIENGSPDSTIAGGTLNRIENNSYQNFIGGGASNRITGQSFLNAIGNGSNNLIGGNSTGSVIGGGVGNVITSNGSIGASDAVIPGGFSNLATGFGSLAAGVRASALHNGAFVWGDFSDLTPISSTASNQFVLRAAGGLRFAGTGVNSTTSPVFIHQAAPCGSGTFDGSRTAINHPLANGDPNAVLLVTPNYGNGSGAGPVPRNPVGVYYEDGGGGGCPVGRWVIYDVTTSPLPFTSTMRFNVMIIKP